MPTIKINKQKMALRILEFFKVFPYLVGNGYPSILAKDDIFSPAMLIKAA